MAASSAAAAPPRNSPFTHEEQPSSIHQTPSKSDSNALFKTLIIISLVLAIPLFPSQAPDFITQTVFTDFWEIIHLLFIGIAVSYGLFGRRTAQIAPERFAESVADDSRSYLSGVSQFTSIFDDGYDNACYEHDVVQNYVNFGDNLLGNDEFVAASGSKVRSFVPNDVNESVWRSRYSKGESVVVVSNAKSFHGGSSDFKPLNLPVRSLRSRAMDSNDEQELRSRAMDSNDEQELRSRAVDSNDEQEFKNRKECSSPKFEASGSDDDGGGGGGGVGGGDGEVVRIRGVAPLNLEKRFEEVSGKSKIPWRSRSGRMKDEEDVSTVSHHRPHSVGEFEFENLKSRALKGSRFSSSPELRSSKDENLERKRVLASHSKVASFDSEASSSSSFSNAASSEMESVEDSENKHGSSGVEEDVRKGKQAIESSESDAKSSPLSKASSRAKSVRTIKPKGYVLNQKEQGLTRGDAKFRRRFIKYEGEALINEREEEPELPSVDHQNQEPGRIFSMPKPKPTLPEFVIEEKQDTDGLDPAKSKDTEIQFDKNSDEDDSRTNIESDYELGSEVDRKAGEFIAKFREQIRLQKASSSMEGYSSGW